VVLLMHARDLTDCDVQLRTRASGLEAAACVTMVSSAVFCAAVVRVAA
jgi:hypothetical protein